MRETGIERGGADCYAKSVTPMSGKQPARLLALDDKEAEYPTPAPHLPCRIDVPPNLVPPGQPGRINGGAQFGPFALYHNERIRSFDQDVGEAWSFQQMPPLGSRRRSQRMQAANDGGRITDGE